MLFDSLFSINEQQKAKAWSDFFKELKKDMKEIYARLKTKNTNKSFLKIKNKTKHKSK